MKTIAVTAKRREKSGKEVARKLRAQGFAPAIFYGFDIEPVKLVVDSSEFVKQLGKDKAEGTFVKLKIEQNGDSATDKLTIIKDLQIDSVNRKLVHVDFYEIKMDRELAVDITISLVGTPKGLEHGGELQVLKREVKVSGLPGMLPEFIDVDVSGLNVGDTAKVSDIVLEGDITILDGEDVALATVAKTRTSLAAVEEGAEITEGEEDAEEAASDSEE